MDILEEVEARKKSEAKKFVGSGSGGSASDGDGISSKFVRDCLYANELGDGMLYVALHQNRYIFDTTAERWMNWTGHYWEHDEKAQSLAAVENVALRYLKEANEVTKQINSEGSQDALKDYKEALFKRVGRLRSQRGRNNCLKFAHCNIANPLVIRGEEFDRNPWLLACKNGVLDLRTGKLRPGRSDDYISKACPHEWKGIDEPAPTWETFLNEIFEGDEELILYIGRLLGYALTGLTIEHILPILWGQGRNGKGTILETIKHVLGPLAAPIQMEMLLDQGRAKNSSGPSPDIMALRGLRLAFTSESDEGRKISPAKVKWLSGGDTLVGRHPHDRYEVHFKPTHTLILLTNNKPHAPADDFAFWERVHLIPFKLSYVDREPQAENEKCADKTLPYRLNAEAAGILACLVRGCLKWQERGLDPPPIVREATAEYRRDEDILADFIEECCFMDITATVQASHIYDAFKEWFEENVSKRIISQKKFGKMMTKRFRREKKGTYTYFGLGLLSEQFGR